MNKILFPTDFSEAANNAFLFALKIANQLDSELYILHSYQAPVLSFSHAGQPAFVDSVYDQIEISKFEFFKNHTPQLRQLAEEKGLDAHKLIFLFEEGSVVAAVKKVVEKEDIKLVVMGTHGASGFQKQFIGTNTVNVIRNVNIPVLGIPEKADFHPIRKVAFTTLFREKDRSALKEIINLSRYVDATVFCLHVIQDSTMPEDLLQQSQGWTNEFRDANLDFVFIEKENTVEETIHNFITENEIDLLAIVKRNRSFFDRLVNSSLTNNLAFHAETPILVFHEEK